MTRRGRLPAYLCVLAGVVVASALTASPAHATPSLDIDEVRTEPRRVEVDLTVHDLPSGQRLDRDSVTLEVDGTPLELRDTAEVATFGAEESDERRLAVLVIDISDSMFGQPLADAVAAASGYAEDLPENVELAVVTVGTTAQVRLEPTDDRDAVQQLLSGLFTQGSTALYDGLVAATDLVESSTGYDERRVLVLSDGADSSSFNSLATARQRLTGLDTPVDTVAFRTEQTVADLLASFSGDTGGRSYLAEDGADLASAFRSAADAFGVRLVVTAVVPVELSGANSSLLVTVRVGDEAVQTSVPVRFAIDPDAPLPLEVVPGAGWSPTAEYVMVGLVFLGLLAVGLLTFSPLLDRNRRRRRLAQVDQFSYAPAAQRPPAQPQPGSPVTRAALAFSERVVQSRGMEGRIALQLDRAGMGMRPHEWLLLRGLVCVIAAILLALFINPIAALIVGLVGGWLATELFHRRKADKRVQAFATLLPDALQLVIGSLRSGFSLSQSIDAMVRELPDPIASEFGRALGEARLGEHLEDALDRVAERMKSVDLGWAVVAVRVQQQVGGNLAEVLSNTVKTIRERDSLRRHVHALSAEGRLSAWILVALPILAGLFMFTVRTEYAAVLITDPLGLVMLLMGIVLVVVGTFWMARVVKVEI